MNSPFHNIGIVTRPNTPDIQDTAHTLITFLKQHGFTVYLDEVGIRECCIYTQDTDGCHIVNKTELGQYCDLVAVLGGDGTFLSAAREIAPRAVPIIGINQGHLGFLTQIPREYMTDKLLPVLEGKYLAEERILIEAALIREGKTAERALARALGGSCQVPLAAYCTEEDGLLTLRGLVGHPDGSVILQADAQAPAAYADALGRAVAKKLADDGAQELIEAVLAEQA